MCEELLAKAIFDLAHGLHQQVKNIESKYSKYTISGAGCQIDCLCENSYLLEEVKHFFPKLQERAVIKPSTHFRVIFNKNASAVRKVMSAFSNRLPNREVISYRDLLLQVSHMEFSFGEMGSFHIESGQTKNVDYFIHRNGGKITIFGNSSNTDVRAIILRVVREIILREAEARGGFLLHASGISASGNAKIFVGPNCSGKTSLALNLCLRYGASYLGSDRLLILPYAKGYCVEPFPIMCRIGFGTVCENRALKDLLLSGHQFFSDKNVRIARESVDYLGSWLQFGARQKLHLTPLELKNYLGIDNCSGASLKQIIAPMINPKAEQSRSYQLKSPKIFKLLSEEIIFDSTNEWPYPWLFKRSSGADVMRAKIDGSVADISRQVSTANLEFGLSCWRSAQHERLMATLFDDLVP
jgi:hypothetical protein